jgi:hypothetical protein
MDTFSVPPSEVTIYLQHTNPHGNRQTCLSLVRIVHRSVKMQRAF